MAEAQLEIPVASTDAAPEREADRGIEDLVDFMGASIKDLAARMEEIDKELESLQDVERPPAVPASPYSSLLGPQDDDDDEEEDLVPAPLPLTSAHSGASRCSYHSTPEEAVVAAGRVAQGLPLDDSEDYSDWYQEDDDDDDAGLADLQQEMKALDEEQKEQRSFEQTPQTPILAPHESFGEGSRHTAGEHKEEESAEAGEADAPAPVSAPRSTGAAPLGSAFSPPAVPLARITATVQKKTVASSVGISMKTNKGITRIVGISPQGLLADSDLELGLQLVQINGVGIRNARHAQYLIQKTPGELCFVAQPLGPEALAALASANAR